MEHTDLVYKYFSDDDFLRISGKIKEVELTTSGEIRVLFREKKSLFAKNKSIAQIAKDEFYRLKMDNTRDKTGILLFFLLKDRSFYICADSGINSLVEQSTWDNIRNDIQNSFKEGMFLDGILNGLNAVGEVLSKHFPRKSDDTNELTDKVEF
ncbi:MAG: TPM domain-containing protein [bacterium]